jgi:HD-like signal output (HDOD) protein
MPVDPQLRTLEIDVPAQPQALVELSLLLAEDEVNLQELASLIEADMALAAAVLKAVNSSLYGLRGRVQTVQQAITYLGMREVAAVTYEMGLRAVFRHALNVDPWGAHSAGLFEECGKAVLFRHAPDHYRSMLRAAASDSELVTLEHAGFGVSHDALGAALCENWGLDAAAVASVRHHVQVQATLELPPQLARPRICVLSAIAAALISRPEQAEDAARALAAPAQLDETLVLRGARKVLEQLDAARSREGR